MIENKKSKASEAASTQWEFLNPEGVRVSGTVKFNPRPANLAGKTVVLTWNGKPNGNVLLNRIAELLAGEVKDVTIVKLWEVFPSIIRTYSLERSEALAKAVFDHKADIAINSTCD